MTKAGFLRASKHSLKCLANIINNMADDLREKLKILEKRKKSKKEVAFDTIKGILPFFAYLISLAEYVFIKNKYQNDYPHRYVILLTVGITIYAFFLIKSLIIKKSKNDDSQYQKIIKKSPWIVAIYLFLSIFDYLTLKTGILMYPFIPWVNDIINIIIEDYKNLGISALYSLRLLFIGYFIGVFFGLITGILCGYNEKVKYWINPILKILGPIPTATWIPLIMIVAASLFAGSIFIISLGVWFAVSTATMIGISNVDKSYYEVAKTLGASDTELIFKVAVPCAMPNILQGMTQGMSSACISLMIAEMLGVKAGLGWYITWSQAWASYNKMFAAIIIICIVFNLVAMTLEKIKKYLLRWQVEQVNE